jgi:hypothetical protein
MLNQNGNPTRKWYLTCLTGNLLAGMGRKISGAKKFRDDICRLENYIMGYLECETYHKK